MTMIRGAAPVPGRWRRRSGLVPGGWVARPWLAWLLLRWLVAGLAVDFPPVPFMVPDPSQAVHLRRSVALMRDSTEAVPNPVRMLVFGGDMSNYDWWDQIQRQLRTDYPSVQFQFRNESIPRHYSQHARKSAESDLYPFYPDLVILFPAASYFDFTNMVRTIRERTTADILVPNDHVAAYSVSDEDTSPRALLDLWRQQKIGHTNAAALWSYALLPQAAREFGFCLADIRTPWKKYLKDNGLSPTNLVPSWAEPGPHGQFLIAELLKPYFRVITGLPSVDPWDNDRVSTYVVGKDVRWMNGKLTLDFKGNRVDVIAGDGDPVDLDVRIDGRPPSQRLESYYFTRANGFDNLPNPLLLRARSTVLPVDGETWTIRLSDMKADGGRFKFRVSGSVSGADGEGDSQFEFVSKSGRLAILPEDWNVAWCAGLLGAPVPGEVTVQIESRLLGVDRFKDSREPGGRAAAVTTLAQGFANGPHRLELVSPSGRPGSLRAIRVYRPPVLPLPAPGPKRR